VAPALDAFAGLAPRPGLHVLRVDATVTVPDDVRAALQQLHDRMPDAMGEWMNQQGGLILFGARFEPGDDVTVSYAVDAEDKAALLRSIRQSHVQADVTIFAIHAHQGDHDPAHPMEHLRQLAREAIGAGADVVVVSGPHAPAPVELHDGRPIFYGLGDFVWSDVGGPLPAYIWRQTRAVLGEGIDPASMSEADLITRLNADGFSDAWVFRGVLAEVTFGDDGIAGIDLHPVDLGLERSLTRRGIPRVPSSEVGHEIVERMAEMSAPLGTKIARSADIASIVFPEP
jgi:poly-gamma-glutamate synthesis protein (capsule biosynthesis protein)